MLCGLRLLGKADPAQKQNEGGRLRKTRDGMGSAQAAVGKGCLEGLQRTNCGGSRNLSEGHEGRPSEVGAAAEWTAGRAK
jgi:hypothetical protein